MYIDDKWKNLILFKHNSAQLPKSNALSGFKITRLQKQDVSYQ